MKIKEFLRRLENSAFLRLVFCMMSQTFCSCMAPERRKYPIERSVHCSTQTFWEECKLLISFVSDAWPSWWHKRGPLLVVCRYYLLPSTGPEEGRPVCGMGTESGQPIWTKNWIWLYIFLSLSSSIMLTNCWLLLINIEEWSHEIPTTTFMYQQA